MSDFQNELIQRKLSDVVLEVKVDVPWSAYQEYCDVMRRHLRDHYVDITADEIAQNPKVFEMFEQRFIKQATERVRNVDVHAGYGDMTSIFGSEIMQAENERERRMDENLKLYSSIGSMIPVDPKNFQRAVEMLRLAGIVTELPSEFIYFDRGGEDEEEKEQTIGVMAAKASGAMIMKGR